MKRTAVLTLLLLFTISMQDAETAEASKPSEPLTDLKQLRDIVYKQGTMLVELKTEMKYVNQENAAQAAEGTAVKSRLAASESDVKRLKKLHAERPKVAFSAALSASLGPASGIVNVVYSKVITNIGGAYNPNTGIFTAPVRGVYYIRFTTCSQNSGYNSGVQLYKNSEKLLYLYEYNYNGYQRYITGGITLQLEVGDAVHTRLPDKLMLYETDTNRNTFSGFLIFTIMQDAETAEASKPSEPLTDLKQLRDIMYKQGTMLVELKTEMKYVNQENAAQAAEGTAVKSRLAASESDVKRLKKLHAERPKVAFSAALSASLGPASGIVNVVYSKVITNIGGAYNPNTGIFTAPVRGVYYIRFTTCSQNSGYNSGVQLYKNSEKLLYLYEYNYNGYQRYITGGITLQLESLAPSPLLEIYHLQSLAPPPLLELYPPTEFSSTPLLEIYPPTEFSSTPLLEIYPPTEFSSTPLLEIYPPTEFSSTPLLEIYPPTEFSPNPTTGDLPPTEFSPIPTPGDLPPTEFSSIPTPGDLPPTEFSSIPTPGDLPPTEFSSTPLLELYHPTEFSSTPTPGDLPPYRV
ncbi:hypothetical protein P4O66_002703 [Electrophorus voltai]|uniref:C1q domain-containing protein n=1 Tax=Electrophorus voltai TaxID=2609070 RepID=A0AAD8YTY0_9TELE|nr:hypothetical protein P4O66_002703 [Electrophorus voltai]